MKLKLKLLEQQLQYKEPKGKELAEFRKNLYSVAMNYNLSLLERKLAAEFALAHVQITGTKLTRQILKAFSSNLNAHTIKELL